jgi:hypothetical protein
MTNKARTDARTSNQRPGCLQPGPCAIGKVTSKAPARAMRPGAPRRTAPLWAAVWSMLAWHK